MKHARCWLVGEAPSRTSDPRRPLSGRSGAFLERLIGLRRGDLRMKFECFNLSDVWPGGGRSLGAAEARAGVDRLAAAYREVARGNPAVIMLGRRVARAFGVDSRFLLRGILFLGGYTTSCVVVPHPSGLNRWWNDAENRARAAELLKEYCRGYNAVAG